MKNIIITILFFAFFISCNNHLDNDKPVARVLGHKLYQNQIPQFDSHFLEDSMLFVNNFINKWAMQKLLIYKAEFNIKKDQFYIDSLVNVYRESLLIHYYKQALIHTYLDTIINDSLVKNYHSENVDNFRLKENIVNINYIKIRNVAPNLEFIKDRYTSEHTEEIDELQDYCLQFADRFFLDDISWISFSDFVKQLPFNQKKKINNQTKFLKKNKKVEFEDENYKYYIFIKDFRLKGTSSPLEYVSSMIRKILINKRKKDIIYSIEDKLIQEAFENDNFEIYE